jgi:hypothetical protein
MNFKCKISIDQKFIEKTIRLWKVLKRNVSFWKNKDMRDEGDSINENVGMNLYWFSF